VLLLREIERGPADRLPEGAVPPARVGHRLAEIIRFRMLSWLDESEAVREDRLVSPSD